MTDQAQNWWESIPTVDAPQAASPQAAAAPPVPAQQAPTQAPELPAWAVHDTPQPQQSATPAEKPSDTGKWWESVPAIGTLLTPKSQPAPATWANAGAALPAGLYSGVAKTANLPTYAVNAVSDAMSGLTGQNYGHLKPPIDTNPANYSPVGPLATGIHDASEAAANMATLGPAARLVEPLLPAGSAPQIAASAMSRTGPGAVTAAAAGGAAEEPIAEHVPIPLQPLARIGANVGVGGLTAAAENAVANTARGTVDRGVAQLAQQARDTYGIPIRAGQISGNRVVRTADSALQSVPFSGLQGAAEEQQTALNRAVAQQIGETADKITPEVMNAARRRIGGGLNDIEDRNSIQFDQPLVNSFADIESNARTALTDQEYAVVRRQLDNVLSTAQPGDQITGQTYGNLIHKGSPLDAMLNNSNPNIAGYGSQIREALRDSLQRSLSGDDLAAYQQFRSQWKAMKTIEPLTLRADVVGGASPATGDIIPSQLRGVVSRSYKNSAYAEPGDIPLNDLANIGQRFMKETPSSHTSERSNIFRWLERGGALAGALVGGEHYLGIPATEVAIPAAVAGATTLGLARAAGKTLGSDRLANRMIQRGLAGPSQGPGAIGQGVQQGVPLLTSAGVRQLESPPPEAPQTSRNPATGLPEFSLKANQDMAKGAASLSAAHVAGKLMDGSLQSHADTQRWIDQNKRGLRMQFGGQGIQNINMIASLLRRAQSEPDGASTVFSLLANKSPPAPVADAAKASGIKTPQDLIALAIGYPPLAKEFSTKVSPGGRIGRAAQTRLAAAFQTAAGGARLGTDDDPVPSGGRLGSNPASREGRRFPQEQVQAPQVAAFIPPQQGNPAARALRA